MIMVSIIEECKSSIEKGASMGTWLNELLDAIKEKKDLPIISEDEIDEEMDEEVMSEELGNS